MLPGRARSEMPADLLIVTLLGTVVFLTSVRIDGIEYDMRMDMVSIHVRTDDRLKPVQVFPHKFFGYLQRQFRCDLTGTE